MTHVTRATKMTLLAWMTHITWATRMTSDSDDLGDPNDMLAWMAQSLRDPGDLDDLGARETEETWMIQRTG